MPSVAGLNILKKVDGFNNIKSPDQGNCGKYDEKYNSYCIGYNEWNFNLWNNRLSFIIFVYPEDKILQGAKLASPRADEFIRENYHEQHECESDQPWREKDMVSAKECEIIFYSSHR